jgi:uncharacterized membrane protein (DUF4010 family)
MSALLPAQFGPFLGTIGLAFIIGLELHAYRRRGATNLTPESLGFGTTRTVTLLAALGFALWIIVPTIPFIIGFAAVSGFLLLDYRQREAGGDSSLLPSIIGLLAFTLGPLVLSAPLALLTAFVILILFCLGEQIEIRRLSDAFPATEGVTFAKFCILSGLIFPLLPNSAIPYVAGITWIKLWTAVLAISGISYVSYLAHRYLFPAAGSLLTGALGGLYSSTATTLVLARALRADATTAFIPAAVILSTGMMYARLLVIILLLGHPDAALALALPFGGLFFASMAFAALLAWREKGGASAAHAPVSANPLDLPVAMLFAVLFVVFAVVTNFVTTHYGSNGLHLLSFVVGFSDINPFIFSLLDGKLQVSGQAVVSAVLIATASNNLLNGIYSLAFSRRRKMLPATAWQTAAACALFAYALL